MKRIVLLIVLLFSMVIYGKDDIVFNLRSNPSSIDAQVGIDDYGIVVNNYLTERLLKKGRSGEIKQGLASRWERSIDGLIWTFYIREEAKWSNGDDITAENFRDAWLRALNPITNSELAYNFYVIKNAEKYNTKKAKANDVGITVIDKKTLRVELESITPYFEELVASIQYAPFNKSFYNKVGQAKYMKTPATSISSGGYILEKWDNNSIILERNINYYKNLKTKKVIFKFINDDMTALKMYNNKQLDITEISSKYVREGIKKDINNISDGSVWFFDINHTIKELRNRKIRTALFMAIDRKTLVKSKLETKAEVSNTFTPMGLNLKGSTKNDFPREVKSSYYNYNPTEAKKLLAEGLEELGIEKLKKLTILYNNAGDNKVVSEYVANSLKNNLGLEVKLKEANFTNKISQMKKGDFDLAFSGWSLDYTDAMSYLEIFKTRGSNYGKYNNRRYDQLISLANSTLSNPARVGHMVEMEKIISQSFPVLPMYYKQRTYIIKPNIKSQLKEIMRGYYVLEY